MITVKLDEDTAIQALVNRLDYWTDDMDIKALFKKMYENYIYGGCFDGGEFDVMSIVDNDYVNWCSVYTLDDMCEEDWNKLLQLYKDGERDISCESFEDISPSFIEAVSDDETMILVRY